MKLSGISIRYKVLILLTSIPAITLGIYLVMAMNVFSKDKIAYVFESTENVSTALATQVKTQFNSILSVSKPIFQDYLINGYFSEISNTIFNNEFALTAILTFKKSENGEFIQSVSLEKVAGLSEELISPLRAQINEVLNTMNTSRVIKNFYNDDRFFIFEKVEDVSKKRSTIFIVLIRLGDTAEVFRGHQSQTVLLTDRNGKIMLGPNDTENKFVNDYVGGNILDTDSSIGFTGSSVKEIKTQSNGNLLVSYSKVGIGDLFVISSVKKELALSAVDILIRKSILFFGVLVSITIIISIFASSSITSALSELFVATKKVTEGNFDIKVEVTSNDEVGTLAENFNIMAAEVSRLLSETAEKARMQSELQTAKTVQETLFPNPKAQMGNLKICGFYEPASECGGDWWHYCQIGSKIFLWIGDATGHGAPAALITSAAKSASTIIERLNISPSKALELLNRSIYDVSKGRIMMTFFLAAYDLESGAFTYSNASHEAPYLIKKGTDELKKKHLIPLNEVVNARLGQDRDAKYNETTIQLDPEDSVFFYTDGIPEINDSNNNPMGERDFLKFLVKANKDFPDVDESVRRLVESLNEFRQNSPLVDDVTFFIVKRELI